MAEDPRKGHYERAWVKAIGRRRLTAFERAVSDPDLVSMRQELAKLDLRIADLEERAKRGESVGAWQRLRALATELELRAMEESPDREKVGDLAARIAALSREALDEVSLWDELKQLIELRRRISDTERKYEELHKLLIPHSQLVRMFDELHGAIEAVIEDRPTQLKLIYELRHRLNGEQRPSSGRTTPIALPAAYTDAPPPPADEGPDYEVAEPDPVEPEPDSP